MFSFIDFFFEREGLSAPSAGWEEIVVLLMAPYVYANKDDFTILSNPNVETPHQRVQMIHRFK